MKQKTGPASMLIPLSVNLTLTNEMCSIANKRSVMDTIIAFFPLFR